MQANMKELAKIQNSAKSVDRTKIKLSGVTVKLTSQEDKSLRKAAIDADMTKSEFTSTIIAMAIARIYPEKNKLEEPHAAHVTEAPSEVREPRQPDKPVIQEVH